MRLFYDMEGNALLDDITVIHCIVTIDAATGVVMKFHDHPELCERSGTVLEGINWLNTAEELIAHYQIKFDAPAIKKVTGIDLTPVLTDTCVMSKLFNPDRIPEKGVRSGPHSIEAWGVRSGLSKPTHDDWSTFTPDMLHRCVEDTRILEKVYDYLLMNEAGNYDWSRALKIEHKVEQITMTAEQHGWPFDKPKAELHSETLQGMMDSLWADVSPKIPLIPKPQETKLSATPRDRALVVLAEQLGLEVREEITRENVRNEETGEGEEQVTRDIFITDDMIQLLHSVDRNWVRKPFLISGKPNGHVVKFMGEEASQVSGPFCRVNWEEINLNSDKQVKTLLLKLGWQPLEWNFSKKTGEVTSPKLTEASLEFLKNPIGKQIAKWIKCSHRHSQIAGWLKALRPDGRVPSVVNAMGTPTSRMTHKVIANVPSIDNGAFFAKEMRELFIAEEGYVIVGTDASSCQLRKLCHYMGDPDYTKAVLTGNSGDGTDIHSVNMRITGVANRTQAKRFIYGFLFGGGPALIGKIVGKGKQAGKRVIERFLSGLPALDALRDGVEDAWKDRGYLIGLDGRKIFIRKKHMLLCYLLQCAEAVLMKVALCILIDWIEQERLDARLVCIYHDEYNFMVKREHAERVKFLSEKAIEKAGEILNVSVPTTGEGKIGNSWAEVH